jgi:hypothetical protein
MPSVDDTCSLPDEGVGEAWTVGVTIGMMASRVEVGTAAGGTLVGTGVDVDWIADTSGVVQAARRNKETMMNFFMINNYMSLQGGAERRRSNLLLNGTSLLTGLLH